MPFQKNQHKTLQDITRILSEDQIRLFLLLYSLLHWNCHWNCWQWSFITFFSLAVRDVIEYLWYGQTIMLQQTDSLCPPHAGLMAWSLWPIYFVCNAGKLDSLFPDDSYIDMGEIDVGRKVAQQIPPGIFWRSQVFIDHPMYLKFNVSLSKDALVGIYGRRGLPPSHTQVGNFLMSLTPVDLLLQLSYSVVLISCMKGGSGRQ